MHSKVEHKREKKHICLFEHNVHLFKWVIQTQCLWVETFMTDLCECGQVHKETDLVPIIVSSLEPVWNSNLRSCKSATGTMLTTSFWFGTQIFNNVSEPVGSGNKFLWAIWFRVLQIGPVMTSTEIYDISRTKTKVRTAADTERSSSRDGRDVLEQNA